MKFWTQKGKSIKAFINFMRYYNVMRVYKTRCYFSATTFLINVNEKLLTRAS